MADNSDMSVREAGQKGGRRTSETHGREFYEKIGQKGGQRGSQAGRAESREEETRENDSLP